MASQLGYSFGKNGDFRQRLLLENLVAKTDPRYRLNSLNGDGLDTAIEVADFFNRRNNDFYDQRDSLGNYAVFDAPYADAKAQTNHDRGQALANNFRIYATRKSAIPEPEVDTTKDIDLMKRVYAKNLYDKLINGR